MTLNEFNEIKEIVMIFYTNCRSSEKKTNTSFYFILIYFGIKQSFTKKILIFK